MKLVVDFRVFRMTAAGWRQRVAVMGLGVVLVTSLWGQSLEEMGAGVRRDLQQALTELATVQEVIESERLPLARKVNALEDQVLAQRDALSRAQREADNQLVSLGVLRKDVERARSEVKFLEALLTEYGTRFETRIHIAEVSRYSGVMEGAKAAPNLADLTPAERLARQSEILETSVTRLDGVLGGERFAGKALTSEGRLESGRYALLGPVALFASDDGSSAGIAELRLGSPQPRSIELGDRQGMAIRSLVTSGQGVMPLDTSLGNALKIAEKQDTVVAHIMKGGPVMIPILLLGLSAVAIALIKWFQLAQIRTLTPMDLQKLLSYLRQGEGQEAKGYVARITGPVGELLQVALEHASDQKEYLEEVLYEKMLEARPKLERLLPVIALTAATAPLLGLLGTVTGMINTFNMITIFGAGDPRTLSGGISEALITTEFGLIVAIPALLLHAFISRKVKGVLGSMEQTSVAFINGVPESQST